MSDPRVVFAQEPEGLPSLLGDLVAQNLLRDPSRAELLTGGLATLIATDAGVAATVRLGPGDVEVASGAHPAAVLVVRAPGTDLLGLAASPLRFGLPDPLSRQGRHLVAEIVRGRIRMRGALLHVGLARRLTMLLSAR